MKVSVHLDVYVLVFASRFPEKCLRTVACGVLSNDRIPLPTPPMRLLRQLLLCPISYSLSKLGFRCWIRPLWLMMSPCDPVVWYGSESNECNVCKCGGATVDVVANLLGVGVWKMGRLASNVNFRVMEKGNWKLSSVLFGSPDSVRTQVEWINVYPNVKLSSTLVRPTGRSVGPADYDDDDGDDDDDDFPLVWIEYTLHHTNRRASDCWQMCHVNPEIIHWLPCVYVCVCVFVSCL